MTYGGGAAGSAPAGVAAHAQKPSASAIALEERPALWTKDMGSTPRSEAWWRDIITTRREHGKLPVRGTGERGAGKGRREFHPLRLNVPASSSFRSRRRRRQAASCYDEHVRIETVLLDAGGVLVFANWDRVSDMLARHGVHVSAEALRAAEPGARFAMDTAAQVAATRDADRGSRYFELVFSGAGIPPEAPIEDALPDLWAYHTEHNLWEIVPDDVRPALARLRALGVRLAIASNSNGTLHRLFDRLELTPYFHAICDSCVEGVEKPDRRFFEAVLDRAGARPESAIHVGDLYHVDVAGARNTGVRPILIDPHDRYIGRDVERVKSLGEVVALVEASRGQAGHEGLDYFAGPSDA